MKYLLLVGLFSTLSLFTINNDTDNAEFNDQLEHSHLKVEYIRPVIADTTKKGEYPLYKTEAEWKKILTAKEYRILREKGTELPWVNEYYDNKKDGIYVCAACGQQLFSSDHKYKSGTGWPSFWKPISSDSVEEKEDNSWFMTRTEIVCSNCGSHIGHVFDDGPNPTGLRYCMNSAALDFIEKSDSN